MTLRYFFKHYGLVLVFFLLSVTLITGFLQLQAPQVIKAQILIGLSLAYVIWGITYHNFTKSLTTEVVIEYILIALLGIIILYGFI